MVDQLALEYADRPVVFVEDNVDQPSGHRRDRWWAGYGSGGSVYLPLVMAGSGHRVSTGSVDFHGVYSRLVDDELARPPGGEVEAYARRVGDVLRVYLLAVNLTAATLSTANGATAEAVVWEDKPVHVTSRTVRAAPWVPLTTPVTPGGTLAVVLDSPSLVGVDWSKLHAVAFVDYRPGGVTGAYDMLQAAVAETADLLVTPADLDVNAAELGEDGEAGILAVHGPHVLHWTVASDSLWLTASPGAGGPPAVVTVAIDRGRLPAGVSGGKLTFTATSDDGMSFSREVEVRVDAPDLSRRVRPRVLRSAGL